MSVFATKTQLKKLLKDVPREERLKRLASAPSKPRVVSDAVFKESQQAFGMNLSDNCLGFKRGKDEPR